MVVVYLLLAAPVASAVVLGIVGLAGSFRGGRRRRVRHCSALAAIFGPGVAQRSRWSLQRERTTESLYVVTAIAGVALLAVAVFGAV